MVDFEKVLKDCAFNTKKLEEKFSKKHTSHAKIPHAHTTHNTSHAKSFHAHNSHAHKSHSLCF